jgi:ATP-dependent helicase/DNAse subunit B
MDTESDHLVEGRFAHEVLSSVYAALRAQGVNRLDASTIDAGLAVHDQVLESLRPGYANLRIEQRLRLETIGRQTGRILREDARLLPGLEVLLTEWEFASNGCPIDVRGLRLHGRVDRVDAGPGGIVVQDYKSGDVVGQDKWPERGLLQLPLYALFVSAALERPVIGAIYRSLSRGTARGFVVDGSTPVTSAACDVVQSAQPVLEWALEAGMAAAEGIQAGDIRPKPVHKSVCAHCRIAAHCDERLK